jgi:hypothetical protein
LFKNERTCRKVCCLSDLLCNDTSDLTAGHRFIGSSLPNSLGNHSVDGRFQFPVGFIGISQLIVVVGDAHTQATDAVVCCATAVVAKNSFSLHWLDFSCGFG